MTLNRDRLVLKFEEHTTGVAQAVSELATLFPEVRMCDIPYLMKPTRITFAFQFQKDTV